MPHSKSQVPNTFLAPKSFHAHLVDFGLAKSSFFELMLYIIIIIFEVKIDEDLFDSPAVTCSHTAYLISTFSSRSRLSHWSCDI